MPGRVSYGPFLKRRFTEAGIEGLVFADLFKELKNGEDEYRVFGTYNSFARFMYWYRQLGYIQPVPDGVEPSYQKGIDEPDILKQKRQRYSITPKGQRASSWINPLAIIHPEWSSTGEKKKEYMREYMKEYRYRRAIARGIIPGRRGRPPLLRET